jgi:prepilin-type N-terminal cleavage/methylation domain-containing protein
MMKSRVMRSGMTMIELIFSIVIIAIVMLSIPSMMSVADQASKRAIIDDDVLLRLMGWTMEKSQARWDQNYFASDSGILWIAGSSDLNCSRGAGNVWYRDNNDSMFQCSDQNLTPSVIGTGDGNLTKGIEQLNGGTERITLTTMYDVNATYSVAYVDSNVSATGNKATAIWILGASGNMNPVSPSGNTGTTKSHLKRIVTHFYNDELDLDMTLTFFKSNKGN